ncbi:MAG: GntR family transcriptional regulator [Planctomycetes bacterium]|nr:GntR family transcriptional regulator [Planctomycetota bacterium]
MLLADEIARSIQTGEFTPGMRLPSTQDLARRHGVTVSIMQAALAQLHRRGLIERSQRAGSFVSQRGTSDLIGVMVGRNVLTDPDMRFYLHLLDCLGTEALAQGLFIRLYAPPSDGSEERALSELNADIATGRLRALLALHRTEVLQDVLVRHPSLPSLDLPPIDYHAVGVVGAGYLLDGGSSAIAVIPPDDFEAGAAFLAGVRHAHIQRGLGLDHLQALPGGNRRQHGHELALRLLADADTATLPTVWLVGDDNTFNGLVATLLLHGVPLLRDHRFATLANRGIEPFFPLSVATIEFDPLAAARSLLANLAAHLAGRQLPVAMLTPRLVLPA